MTSESVTLIAPDIPIRDWLRGESLACGARVYCDGTPKAVTLPAISFWRIGGPLVSVMDQGLYQFNCYGATMPDAKDLAYELATLLASTFEQELTATPDGVRLAGAAVASLNPINDPVDPEGLRVAVTAQLVIIHIP